MTRAKARQLILDVANRGRATIEPYRMRHLARAVARVRNRRLVKPEVLVAAGFNAHGPNRRAERVDAA